jgi:hypothetical protein
MSGNRQGTDPGDYCLLAVQELRRPGVEALVALLNRYRPLDTHQAPGGGEPGRGLIGEKGDQAGVSPRGIGGAWPRRA